MRCTYYYCVNIGSSRNERKEWQRATEAKNKEQKFHNLRCIQKPINL